MLSLNSYSREPMSPRVGGPYLEQLAQQFLHPRGSCRTDRAQWRTARRALPRQCTGIHLVTASLRQLFTRVEDATMMRFGGPVHDT